LFVKHYHQILKLLLEHIDDFVLPRYLSSKIINLFLVSWLLLIQQITAKTAYRRNPFAGFVL